MSVTTTLFVVVFPAACLRNQPRRPKAFAFSRMSFSFFFTSAKHYFFRIFDWSLEEWRESLIFFFIFVFIFFSPELQSVKPYYGSEFIEF